MTLYWPSGRAVGFGDADLASDDGGQAPPLGLGLVEDILLELIRVDAEHDGGLLACRGHRCFGGGPLDNESVVEVPDHCFN